MQILLLQSIYFIAPDIYLILPPYIVLLLQRIEYKHITSRKFAYIY